MQVIFILLMFAVLPSHDDNSSLVEKCIARWQRHVIAFDAYYVETSTVYHKSYGMDDETRELRSNGEFKSEIFSSGNDVMLGFIINPVYTTSLTKNNNSWSVNGLSRSTDEADYKEKQNQYFKRDYLHIAANPGGVLEYFEESKFKTEVVSEDNENIEFYVEFDVNSMSEEFLNSQSFLIKSATVRLSKPHYTPQIVTINYEDDSKNQVFKFTDWAKLPDDRFLPDMVEVSSPNGPLKNAIQTSISVANFRDFENSDYELCTLPGFGLPEIYPEGFYLPLWSYICMAGILLLVLSVWIRKTSR